MTLQWDLTQIQLSVWRQGACQHQFLQFFKSHVPPRNWENEETRESGRCYAVKNRLPHNYQLTIQLAVMLIWRNAMMTNPCIASLSKTKTPNDDERWDGVVCCHGPDVDVVSWLLGQWYVTAGINCQSVSLKALRPWVSWGGVMTRDYLYQSCLQTMVSPPLSGLWSDSPPSPQSSITQAF